MHLHRYQMALECFNRLIGLGHRQASVWVQKGIALYYLGDYVNSIKAYDEALKLKPDDAKISELRKKAQKEI